MPSCHAQRALWRWSPFAAAATALGDRSAGLEQIEAYRTATRTWKRLLDNPKYSGVAVKHFDDLTIFARTFDAARDWPDAATAYDVARKIALRNLDANPSNTIWKDNAVATAKRAAEAERSLALPTEAACVENVTKTSPSSLNPTKIDNPNRVDNSASH